MDWVLRSPQIHSTFSNLGFVKNDGYYVNENCNSALETILHNILSEDKYLRSYRRSISYGQNIQKDIIPLLMHTKDDKTVELIVRILVNLTIPIECLLNVDIISRTDYGRYTILDINNLLASTKAAFTDLRVSKALIDFMKKNSDVEPKVKLSEEQRINVSNCLLLLRNILHIPEDNGHLPQTYNGSTHSIQNKILWNIFSQSVDKIIIKSMTILDANSWAVTLVQLLALIYKDQHNATLSKLLNNWLEASLSESSEDNESNTSPPDRAGSDDSSPMLTSASTSDSSDNGGGGGDECGGSATSMHASWRPASVLDVCSQMFSPSEQDNTDDDKSAISRPETGDEKSFGTANEEQTKLYTDTTPSFMTIPSNRSDQTKNQKQMVMSEASDCGYGTNIENHESISTSSNEDEPVKKPVHQKLHNAKRRSNNKPRLGATTHDRKRRKMVKRGKANIINVQGLSHKTPTDEDISNVLKEFTVDFLLKGYNSLVLTLRSEILTNPLLEIDTSHFFWLLTYFLKFASQIELDLEYIDSVLSFEIVAYLISEGVNLCEQFELSIKLDGSDLSPNIRRQHLVVTAIREFVQAIEGYKKNPHLNKDSCEKLKKLQHKMCEAEDLRSMFVLLLRHFNPKYHSKQYLQDLIVTNHMLLMFLDKGMKLPDYNSSSKMIDHLQQFATTEMMAQYGLLLNDFMVNGEYVNDCIFTLMHHVGGELDSLETLFQSNILKTFTAILKSDFQICDDWSDLIEYVINTFVKKPSTLINTLLLPEVVSVEESQIFVKPIETSSHYKNVASRRNSINKNDVTETTLERWTEDEISALNWSYLQNNTHADIVNRITKQLKEDGISKANESVIKELFRQNLISRDFYESQVKGEREFDFNTKPLEVHKVKREDEIAKFCELLILDGKAASLDWVQKVLLDICNTKLQIHKRNLQKTTPMLFQSKLLNFEIFRVKHDELPVVSSVAYHSLIKHQPVPLVPWNCQQANICKDFKFLQLLDKLGFHMPVNSGKFFIRIPHSWTADFLLSVAGKIRPIDTSKLKFEISELSGSGAYKTKLDNTFIPSGLIKDRPLITTPDNYYQIHKQSLATMVNYTPRPGSSFKPEVEAEQFTWLQFVQKSQGRKINLNLERLTETTEDIVMNLPTEDDTASVALEPEVAALSSLLAATPPLPHTRRAMLIPTSSAPATPVLKSDSQTTAPAEPLDEVEPFESTFETASVASDLTYMYVSDEEEKPKVVIPPIIDPGISSIYHQQTSRYPARVAEYNNLPQ